MDPSTTLHELWDTTRLRLLIEIERRGSLSAAAESIGIGQPSASQHLRLLETAAGQRLVERNGRGSRLTEAGRVLSAGAAQALATLGGAEEQLAALAGLQTGTIRLGAATTPGVYLLPDTLGCFRREFPNVTIEVEIAGTDGILLRLLGGGVQLALVGTPTTADPRIGFEPFLEDEIIGVARPGLVPARRGRLDPEELTRQTLLCRERGSSARTSVEQELAAISIRPAAVWELGSPEALKRAAREGLGVAFLSQYAVAEEVERGELESFVLRGRPPLRSRLAVARLATRSLSPAESSFVATLTRCCAKQETYARACIAQR
jgi:molybdate transport repressor ModE-like protein